MTEWPTIPQERLEDFKQYMKEEHEDRAHWGYEETFEEFYKENALVFAYFYPASRMNSGD